MKQVGRNVPSDHETKKFKPMEGNMLQSQVTLFCEKINEIFLNLQNNY